MFKIDNSLLQAGALAGVTALGVTAACHGQWNIVYAAIVGLFAVLNIHPKDTPAPPAAPPAPDPNG